MRSNWQIKKLGEICDFHNGLWKGKKPPYIEVGVIRNTNFTKDGKLDDANIAYLNVEKKQFEKRKLSYGDIVLEKSGGGPKQAVGRVIIFNKKENNFSFSNFTSVIRIKRKDQVDFNYLHKYLFFSYMTGVTESMQSHSTGIRNLNFKLYKEIEVPLPSFTKQKRIVKTLDEVFEKIAKAKENSEKNLQNARELFESYLQSIFNNPGDEWEEKSLEELGNITSSKRIYKSEYVNEGIPFYRTKEIKELANGKNISLELFISRERYNEIKTKYGIPKEGDILLSAVGTIGEIYVVQRNDEFYFKDGNIVWLKEFNLVNAYYLKYALKSFVEKIKTLSRGAAYKALTIEKLKKYKVPIMSIKEQQSIIAKLDELSAETKKFESIYQQKLEDLEELKKSILKKAFNGEL